MGTLHVLEHPLLQHKLSIIRDKNTSVKEFRELISEIATLMCYEAMRDLPVEVVEVETPVAVANVKRIAGKKLAIVPILRAGLGMVDGLLRLVPSAKVGHIGLYRDPDTLEPVEYYCKLPKDISEREVYIVDPMLATGGSRHRRHPVHQELWLPAHQAHVHHLFPRGHQPRPGGSPRRGYLRGRRGRKAQQPRLHRPRPAIGDAGDRIFGTK